MLTAAASTDVFRPARVGRRVPNVALGELQGDEISTVHTENLFLGLRAVVIGVPGAFTPVCTKHHLPSFIESAPKLKASGFGLIACIAPNDPFTVAHWARELDPEGRVRLLSDGNLSFTRALGLSARADSLFLGERSQRYVMTLNGAVIEKLRIETDILNLFCTTADSVMLD